MLKELIGSILLAAFSARSTPLRANNTQEYLQLKGYYCLKDQMSNIDTGYVIGNDTFFDHYIQEEDGLYTHYNYFTTSVQMVSGTRYYSVASLYIEDGNQAPAYTYGFTFTDLDLSNNTSKMKNYIMYVPNNYGVSVTSGNASRFLSWFTNEGNSYIHAYSGWYYYTSGTANVDYQIIGSFMVDNKLYAEITYQANYVTCSMPAYLSTEYQETIPTKNIYTNNQWQIKDRNVYIQSLLSDDVYAKMSATGTFAYVPSTNPSTYTFEDLFFNMADTPIYFIYSLFNWKLFGANLFIAFTGLISFALILVLFRTFVWKK